MRHDIKKSLAAGLLLCAFGASGQVSKATKDKAIRNYLGSASSPQLATTFGEWNNLAPGTRPANNPSGLDLRSLLPTQQIFEFVAYIMATRYDPLGAFAQHVAEGQMNKMVGSTAGNSGATTLLSSSVAADVLSVATEFGAINQTTSGNTTTARANLAGVAGLFVGDPYLGCNSLAVGCSAGSRLARSFSASISVASAGNSGGQQVMGTNATTGAPASTVIFANGNRMSAWNVRYDLFHKTLYDTTNVKGWAAAMKSMATSATEQRLNDSLQAVFKNATAITWRSAFLIALQNAPAGTLLETLQKQLDGLIDQLIATNPEFIAQVQAAQNAIDATFLQRDDVLRELQSTKFSVEFNGLHPLGQPNLSNIRAIFSYQPAKGPLVLTFNGAAEWYDHVPSGVNVGRFRDVQLAAQVDRSLGTIPQFGAAVLTLAGYYQWIRDAALISIPAGNTVPGTGIVLPSAASTLLATKGNIGIVQAKMTIPIKSGVVKVPISFTWSNRTELINESEKRGQIGLTLDLDSVFKK